MAKLSLEIPGARMVIGFILCQLVLSSVCLTSGEKVYSDGQNPRLQRRQLAEDGSTSPRPRAKVPVDPTDPVIWGFRIEKLEEDFVATSLDPAAGTVVIVSEANLTLRVFGRNLSPSMQMALTLRQEDCSAENSRIFHPDTVSAGGNSANFSILMDPPARDLPKEIRYFCVSKPSASHRADEPATVTWVHQGADSWMQLVVMKRPSAYLLPLWFEILSIVFLLILSGLFSGLNLGLMTLDPTELKIVMNCGSERERRYAKAIMPLRKQGNFLLCTLLLGNVLVNTTLTILMDDLTSGLIAVIGSTLGIVIFGEIIPQALCSRHGMAVGARTIWLTKFFMLITLPLSWPISKLLDWILGAEIGHVYNRERLMELIRVTHGHTDLEQEEVNIISGALELKRKTVAQIMTPLNDVFMIPFDAVLDYDTVSEIMRQGFTRVPVFDGRRTNVVALLNIKDLALVDPDDNTPVKTLCRFYNHHVRNVFDDTTLDVMLDEFKKGRSHMAFVQRVATQEDLDPVYETVGVVTLEDVIEEIIQSEIEDEMDTTADNRRRLKRRDQAMAGHTDVPVFSASGANYQSLVTPQLQLACFQFLSTTLEPFREEIIAPTILRRLLRHGETARYVKLKGDEVDPPCLYTAGQKADYFILILEGRIEVKVGSENLLFQSGPFTYFGISVLNTVGEHPPALMSPVSTDKSVLAHPETFIPDFTVYPSTDLLYLQITRSQYIAAYRASLVDKGKNDSLRDDPLEKASHKAKRQSLGIMQGNISLAARIPNSLIEDGHIANSNLSLDTAHLVPSGGSPDLRIVPSEYMEMKEANGLKMDNPDVGNGPVVDSKSQL